MPDQASIQFPTADNWKRTETSRNAAEHAAGTAQVLRNKIMAAISRRPMTADEACAAVGVSVLSGRPRVTELRKLGMVVDSGERRHNASGRSAIVWKAATETGEEE